MLRINYLDSRVDRGEMDPGAKWSFWVTFAFLEEIEQPIIVQ